MWLTLGKILKLCLAFQRCFPFVAFVRWLWMLPVHGSLRFLINFKFQARWMKITLKIFLVCNECFNAFNPKSKEVLFRGCARNMWNNFYENTIQWSKHKPVPTKWCWFSNQKSENSFLITQISHCFASEKKNENAHSLERKNFNIIFFIIIVWFTLWIFHFGPREWRNGEVGLKTFRGKRKKKHKKRFQIKLSVFFIVANNFIFPFFCFFFANQTHNENQTETCLFSSNINRSFFSTSIHFIIYRNPSSLDILSFLKPACSTFYLTKMKFVQRKHDMFL